MPWVGGWAPTPAGVSAQVAPQALAEWKTVLMTMHDTLAKPANYTNVVLVRGMPKELCQEPMMQVVMQQAGFEKGQVLASWTVEFLPYGEVALILADQVEAAACVSHFMSSRWGAKERIEISAIQLTPLELVPLINMLQAGTRLSQHAHPHLPYQQPALPCCGPMAATGVHQLALNGSDAGDDDDYDNKFDVNGREESFDELELLLSILLERCPPAPSTSTASATTNSKSTAATESDDSSECATSRTEQPLEELHHSATSSATS
mmetsp:Transcript_69652/g.167164  ORF Transcript_69652/g.167164 Transcript_69652/m.167164 type:complete len:264 (+) Transcript_69652:41-832(+)